VTSPLDKDVHTEDATKEEEEEDKKEDTPKNVPGDVCLDNTLPLLSSSAPSPKGEWQMVGKKKGNERLLLLLMRMQFSLPLCLCFLRGLLAPKKSGKRWGRRRVISDW